MVIHDAGMDSEHRRPLLTSPRLLPVVSVNQNQNKGTVNPSRVMSTTSGWLAAARVKEAAETQEQ